MNNSSVNKFNKTRNEYIGKNQTEQLLKLNGYSDSVNLFIQPVIAKNNKDGIGIYAYSQRVSHFGTVKFYKYSDKEVILLDRTNLDSLQFNIKTFLNENHFSNLDIANAEKRIAKTWEINVTDVW